MSNETFFDKLANNLKSNRNPTDLKPCIIGKVVKLEPITVQIESERVLLVENKHLIISEWFTFRKNIDKTGALSSDIPTNIANAEASASCTGAVVCTVPNSINELCSAINSLKTELLNLKLDLQLNDYVLIGSLEETDKYILLDKV